MNLAISLIGNLVASVALAQSIQCGPLEIDSLRNGSTGTIKGTEVACETLAPGSGWGTTVMMCAGGDSSPLADGTCTPKYLVYVDNDGSAEISVDTSACHSCADYSPIYDGVCK